MFRPHPFIRSPQSRIDSVSTIPCAAAPIVAGTGDNRGSKSSLLIGLLACLLFAPAALAQAPAEPKRNLELVESIAAQVGSDIILASEVLELTGPIEEKMRAAGAPPTEIVRIRRDALERLIEGKLLTSVVERLELTADREEVDQAINAIAEENGLTQEELLGSIQSHGLSVEEYRGKIREEIERSKVVNAMVRSRVQISDEEVEALYAEKFGSQRSGGEEIHIRHILVMTEGGAQKRSPAEACSIAEQARNKIVSNKEPFGAVAQRVSDMNPRRGGELGWMHRKDLAGWMAKTVEKLEPGQTSPVVEMPFGCNLLQVVDRREFTPVDFADAKTALQNEVFNRKTEAEYIKWLDVLRGQVYIERKGSFSAGNDDSASLGGGASSYGG